MSGREVLGDPLIFRTDLLPVELVTVALGGPWGGTPWVPEHTLSVFPGGGQSSSCSGARAATAHPARALLCARGGPGAHAHSHPVEQQACFSPQPAAAAKCTGKRQLSWDCVRACQQQRQWSWGCGLGQAQAGQAWGELGSGRQEIRSCQSLATKGLSPQEAGWGGREPGRRLPGAASALDSTNRGRDKRDGESQAPTAVAPRWRNAPRELAHPRLPPASSAEPQQLSLELTSLLSEAHREGPDGTWFLGTPLESSSTERMGSPGCSTEGRGRVQLSPEYPVSRLASGT